MRVSNRTISSFISTGLLVAIVVIVYGLDWRAALWAEGFDTPVAPAPDRVHEHIVIERR